MLCRRFFSVLQVVVSAMVDAGHVFVQQPTHPTFSNLTKLDGYMLAVYSQTNGVRVIYF